jgi:hypothetical protein
LLESLSCGVHAEIAQAAKENDGLSVFRAFAKMFPSQIDVDALVLYIFDRRFGWSEACVDDDVFESVASKSSGAGFPPDAARKRQLIDIADGIIGY